LLFKKSFSFVYYSITLVSKFNLNQLLSFHSAFTFSFRYLSHRRANWMRRWATFKQWKRLFSR